MQSIKVHKYTQVHVLDNSVLYVGPRYLAPTVYRCTCIPLPITTRSVQITSGSGSMFTQLSVWLIAMDLSKIEFGAEMKKECFHFEEGYVFVNHAAYGEVPVLMRDKQKQ